MKQTIFQDAVQLSLFPTPIASMTDEEILASITNKPCQVCDSWQGDYRMERFYKQLTPSKRRVAEAAVELYQRSRTKRQNAPVIKSSRDADLILRPQISALSVEEFWLIALNNSGRVMGYKRLSVGGLTATMVDIRLIFKALIAIDSTQFIVAHNHPSGSLTPSIEDKNLTQNIVKASQFLHIRLLDHLILTTDGYFSFNDEGIL